MIRMVLAAIVLVTSASAIAREPAGLDSALQRLEREGKFSGAVVIRDDRGIRFARGYGLADPFTGRKFTPGTPVDSGSLAKPVTAAAVLALARESRIDLDDRVRRYLPEFPHSETTVRHLLAHSAGLPLKESPEALADKTNAALLEAVRSGRTEPIFPPGTGFSYCNLCYSALALLIERLTGKHYLAFVRERVGLPPGVTLRPQRLADWTGRAIGYRWIAGGKHERFDSWEGELLYGPANLSISAAQLADWGSKWWKQPLASIRSDATTPAIIAGKASGLSWGSWYCSDDRRRCHYLGHHEGFHHMLYWDAERRISVAMVSNNTLAPGLQQRLQRAIVAFAEGSPKLAQTELQEPLTDAPVEPRSYVLPDGERILLERASPRLMSVTRGGIAYPAYPVGTEVRYVPGLDVYLAGAPAGGLHWLSLYEDLIASPA